jgi:hypothetical protein
MAVGTTSLALGLLAIAGLLWLESGARQRGWISTRAERSLLWLLVGLSFLAHLGWLQRGPEGFALRVPPPHLHEYFHYYVGTKYFAELGHVGLYGATLHADREDVPEAFRPDAPMRDLATNTQTVRGDAYAAGRAVRERFAPERWQAFKRDVGVIREANPAELWHERGYLHDHGYNGTPLATWLLGSLARFGGDITGFINLMRWADSYLFLLLGVLIAIRVDVRSGLVFLAFLFANPLHDSVYVGGAYLRAADLLALCGAWLALRTGAPRSAGLLLGFATLFRIFPVLFLGGLVGHALLQRDRLPRLRRQLPMLASFAGTLVGFGLAAELAVAPPSGELAWTAFARNLSLHASTPATNNAGWPTLVAYAPDKDHHPGLEGRSQPAPAPPGFDWARETERVLDARSGYRWAGTLALLGIAVLCLRRTSELASPIPVMLSLFAITAPGHYYWSLLALVPLATGDRHVRLGLLLAYAAFVLVFWPGPLDTQLDLRFALLSGALGLFLVGACASLWREGRAAALALSLALVALGCGSEPPDAKPEPAPEALWPERAPRIEGNEFRSETLGFGFEKPAGWHFLPGSSLIAEADTRVEDRAELWQRLRKPALTPLVTFATTPDGLIGRDAVGIVHAIPIRPEEGDFALELLMKAPLDRVVNTFAHARAGRNPNFRVVAEPKKIPFEPGDGAQIDLRYDADGGPTHERMTALRRKDVYWYVRVMVPEPVDAQSQEWLDTLPASLRFDP